jgi:hypothetical protein
MSAATDTSCTTPGAIIASIVSSRAAVQETVRTHYARSESCAHMRCAVPVDDVLTAQDGLRARRHSPAPAALGLFWLCVRDKPEHADC